MHGDLQKKQLAPKVLAAATRGVVDMIEHYGGDIDSIFGHSEIDTEAIENPLYELELVRYCNLFEVASKQTKYDYFGLDFGASFKPVSLGPIGYVAINSPTPLAAITNLVRYFPAHQDNSILSLTHHQNLYQLNYEIIDPRITNRRQDAELSIGMFCNIFKHCAGNNWAPVEIHFTHHCIDGATMMYEKIYNCPVLFNQCTNSILFRQTDLNKMMPASDPYLFAILEPVLTQRIQQRASPKELVAEVKQYVKINIGESVPTLSDVAKIFCLSPIHLQKELKDKGFCFNELIRVIRQELALKYVGESDMQLTEVAFALGYSELSAFSRAFKCWTKMSPQKYRQLNK